MSRKIKLVDIAHARSGDKGDAANIGLIAKDEKDYPLLEKYVTADRVKAHFKGICFGPVERFELPNLGGLEFSFAQRAGRGWHSNFAA